MLDGLVQFIKDHWPFITFTLTTAMVVQVFKGAVWTEARCKGTGFKAGLFWWMRKTLPIHPVLVGWLFGLIPGLPVSPDVPDTWAAHSLYYAAAGLTSTWAFSILKGAAKKRGIDLQVPGEGPDEGG